MFQIKLCICSFTVCVQLWILNYKIHYSINNIWKSMHINFADAQTVDLKEITIEEEDFSNSSPAISVSDFSLLLWGVTGWVGTGRWWWFWRCWSRVCPTRWCHGYQSNYGNQVWLFFIFIKHLYWPYMYVYSGSPEAVVVNSDPQNDSVLLYDEVIGELRPLEEGEINDTHVFWFSCFCNVLYIIQNQLDYNKQQYILSSSSLVSTSSDSVFSILHKITCCLNMHNWFYHLAMF